MTKKRIVFPCVLLAFLLVLGMSGCAGTKDSDQTQTTDPASTSAPQTTPAETTDAQTTLGGTEGETTASEPDEPVYINRLTGEAADEETYYKRPVAFMINNIRRANPHVGTTGAMVIYECEVEGGITRQMMLTTDYEALSVVGSIRSSREYFIDYAMGHDAIYVHAGGSDQAYLELAQRHVDNIDGTRGVNPAGTFYRDPDRLATMGAVHAYVTTGDRLAKAIAYHKYRTEISPDTETTFRFVTPGTSYIPDGQTAEHVRMSYTASHCPEFVYDAATGKYLRYQFLHEPQTDSATGQQLSFDNVVILSVKRTALHDEKGHIDLVTSGEGDGYYIYGGKAMAIRYRKANDDAPLRLFCPDGEELLLNTGKTFVNVLSEQQFAKVELNYGK